MSVSVPSELFGAMWPFLAVFFTVMAVVLLICYVFYAIGLFVIAKRRELSNPWFAFIPVANFWIFGRTADQYDIITTGRNMKLRHWTLWLGIAFYISYVVYLVNYFDFLNYMWATSLFTPDFQLVFILMLIMFPFAIAYAVFYYIALYKIYRSCSPENAVVLIVLSIIFSIIVPFVIFAIRKSDRGVAVCPANSPDAPA